MYLILGYVAIIPVLYTKTATPQDHMKAQRPCYFRLYSGKGGLRKGLWLALLLGNYRVMVVR